VQILFQDPAATLYAATWQQLLPTMPAASVDLVLTDPPYDAKTHAGARSNSEVRADGIAEFPPLTDADLYAFLAEAGRVARRWVIATVAWQHAAMLELEPPAGLRFVRMCPWVKRNAMPQRTGDRPAHGWEAIVYLHREFDLNGDPLSLSWNGGGRAGWFDYAIEKGAHPNRKPQPLLRSLVRLFSDPGELVVDPFAGEASTLIAARACERRAIGCEPDPQWHPACLKRLRAQADQGTLFDGNEGTY
jgi:site-specific DNA-methyltransferase (adenine-specific)